MLKALKEDMKKDPHIKPIKPQTERDMREEKYSRCESRNRITKKTHLEEKLEQKI